MPRRIKKANLLILVLSILFMFSLSSTFYFANLYISEKYRLAEILPDEDLQHISIDIQRLYDHLASEWLDYVRHLRDNYPFLYSLVLRTHPFQENPSPIVT